MNNLIEQTSDSEYLINDLDKRSELSWAQRAFSKMKKDSLRGAIFVLIISALGTGILTLHHFFNEIGIIPGIIVIFVVATFFMLSSDILIFAFRYNEAGNTDSINQLIENILNRKFRIIFDILFFVYLFLVMIAVVISISKTTYISFGQTILGWFDVKFDWNNEELKMEHFKTFNFWMSYAIGLLLFLLILQKSVDKFRYTSFFSFLIFIYIILVIIIQFPLYYTDLVDHNENKYNFYSLTLKGFFENFGLAIFAFNCLTNFFSVASSIAKPNIRRLRKVFLRSFSILIIFLLTVGIIGYLSVGQKSANNVDLIIYRKQIGKSDIFMMIGRAFLILALFVNAAVNAFPLKTMIARAIDWKMESWRNFLLSFLFTLLPVVIASFCTSITDYVSITGSFTGSLICFFYPGIIGIKIRYFKNNFMHKLLYLWVIVMFIVTLICTYFAFMKFITK